MGKKRRIKDPETGKIYRYPNATQIKAVLNGLAAKADEADRRGEDANKFHDAANIIKYLLGERAHSESACYALSHWAEYRKLAGIGN